MRTLIFAACAALLCLEPVAANEQVSFKQMIDGIRAQSDKLREASPGVSLKGLLSGPGAKEEAAEVLRELQRTNADMRQMSKVQANKSTYTNHEWLVFASMGMGEEDFLAVLKEASQQQDSVVVLRGIPKGAKLSEAVVKIQALVAQFDPVPNVVINPDLYTKHNIQSVPVVVKLTKRKGRGSLPTEVARVAGLSDTLWLARKIEEGSKGDLGVQGPLSEISEQDFIEAAKERVAAIDWEEKKEQASKTFWKKKRFYELPQAPKARTRLINPAFVATKDITAPNGQKIVRRGQRINPLEQRAFAQAIVVFDPMSSKQLEIVKRLRERLNQDPALTRVNFIATRINRETGWKSYQRVIDELQEHIYLLTPDVKRTFELEYTPAVVTALGNRFQVEEFGVDQ